MKKFVLITLLATLTSCKEYKVQTSSDLSQFKCPTLENCLSSLDTGENNTLHFKMMGEDESQNILNISKLLKKIDGSNIQKIDKNYIYVVNGNIHLEFLASQKERKIHLRSQASKSSLFGIDKGKKLIEEIRFKFYQNDY